jgi:tRNA(adenine34) deaminase
MRETFEGERIPGTMKALAIKARRGTSLDVVDTAMMARCIALSRVAVTEGDYPFASVIALDGKPIAEATNRAIRDGDVSRHAEIIALAQAQKALGGQQLRKCTLYTNVEPCAMCSFCIREVGIGRVVYAIGSPVMGGVSRWNILRDDNLSDRIPQVFPGVPEVVSGVMLHEAQQVWRDWNPVGWQMIKFLGLLRDPSLQEEQIQVRPGRNRSLWRHLRTVFARNG